MMSSSTAEQLSDLVLELVQLPTETGWVEFKENVFNPEDVGQYISALSNSAALADQDRAFMVWGVRDGDHAIVGTRINPFQAKKGNEDLENWLLRLLTPQIFFQFIETSVSGNRVIVLEIHRATSQPIAFQGVEYIRVGSYKKALSAHPEHAKRLWRKFDEKPFEAGISVHNVRADDLNELLDINSYFRLIQRPLPTRQSQLLLVLETERLIRRSGSGRWDITNLGAILFARDWESFPTLERKAPRVIQYKGKSRLKALKEQVGARGYATGFNGLIGYISNILPTNEVIEKALRKEVPMYPDLAIRELVANALIHQDFSMTGTGPLVEIFDDRFEITNPGEPLMSPDRFIDTVPQSRNEILAALMRRVGVCEERGSGWDKIGFEIEYHQLPAPLVEINNSHTKVTMFSPRPLQDMNRSDRIRAIYLHACLRYTNNEKVTNGSVRERFSSDSITANKASRLIKEAVTAGVIALRDKTVGPRSRDYVPWWAAS